MRSEILEENEPIEGSQKNAERRRRGPGPYAYSPKNTDGVLQMDGMCCYLNDGLVAEAPPTSLRLRARHMGKLEDWVLDFRYWMIPRTSNCHWCRVESGDCWRIAGRKENHRRRGNLGLKDCVHCVLTKLHQRAPKLLDGGRVLRYEVYFLEIVLPLTKIDRCKGYCHSPLLAPPKLVTPPELVNTNLNPCNRHNM